MAIKRADVRAIFGETEITSEQMSKLMNLIHSEVDEIKEDNDDLRKQLDEERKNSKASDWEKKYNDEHSAFESYKKDQEAKDTASKKKEALKALLKDSNLSEKGQERALKYASLDDIELDKDGNVKDGKKHIDAFHSEWSDYVTNNKKTPTKTPGGTGAGGEGKKTMTRDEIMKITDAGARQQAIRDNPDAFKG